MGEAVSRVARIDLAELKALGDAESHDLQDRLERIAEANLDAKRIIDQTREDYRFTPYVEAVTLDPVLDRTLEDILQRMGEQPPPIAE